MQSGLRRSSISAFVICQDEERNIRRCLESLKWCDEIIVIDSGSTDETLSICREYTQKVIKRPWSGHIDQKAFGLDQCSSEWVLNIDADEEVSAELCSEILNVLAEDTHTPPVINGYYLQRVVFYLNRWWRKGGWHPERRMRFMRRKFASWGGEDPHEKASVTGKTSRLRGELYHYTYSDMSDHVRSLNTFSSISAHSMFERGERSSFMKVMFNPLARFLKFYFLRRGYREGFAGFLVANLESYYVFLKYAKLWELGKRAKTALKAPVAEPVRNDSQTAVNS